MISQWQKSRQLKEKVVILGTLRLIKPTHIGNGDEDDLMDMPIMKDLSTDQALLPGSSLAGALRSYLARQDPQLANLLFGKVEKDQTYESWVLIDDALGISPKEDKDQLNYEYRDGVAIDSNTQTAEEKKKYDFELISAGTTFELSLELRIPRNHPELKEALAFALSGLQDGSISIGKRKRRGFGRCEVKNWRITSYDFTTETGMIDWLENSTGNNTQSNDQIEDILSLGKFTKAKPCEITATFSLEDSMLIRSEADYSNSPDAIHLHSYKNGKKVPIISGTSLAGALRARTRCIGNTLGMNGRDLANQLFGYYQEGTSKSSSVTASRLWVDECEITRTKGEPLEKVHTRLKIDRFTSGAFVGALFSEQPVYASDDTNIQIKLRLEKAERKYFGLLILLLKDLWTGDLPIGGEDGIGRGLLRGKMADLKFEDFSWKIEEKNNELSVTSTQNSPSLQDMIKDFFNGG